PTTPSTDRPSSVSKRQRTDRRDSNEWTDVRRKKSQGGRAAYKAHTPGRPWASPNAFSALIERWSVGYDDYTASHDGVAFPTFVPEPSMLETDHVHPTTSEYVTCQKQHKGKLSRVEVPLDDLIADIQALESQAAAASHYHSSHVEAAVSGSETDLAALVNKGRVDEIGTFMGRRPVDFGIQLHRLFVDDRPTFELLVRQRLLHRWLRATWGGSASFDDLYTKSFGRKMTKDSMVALFSALQASETLKPITSETADGDEVTLTRIELELVLAIVEMLAMAHSPLYYASDAAIMVTTGSTIEAIPTHRGM
ncbi:hypothetical protein As57867_005534, partial [Aphanomyces stellatus]